MARLFVPGPTDVHPQVLAAQNQPMIGHRGEDFERLFARIQPKLRELFATTGRVYISTSSGTGLQEAAVRNCVTRRVLCCVNGAFSLRWFEVARANGKEAVRLDFDWGHAVRPEAVERALESGDFDAVAIVHNETSTGVASPIQELAARARAAHPDISILVDAVSSLGGDRLDFDAWGLDVLFTSSQKCLAAPPGLAFAAVSDRALEKALRVPHRGLYFDFVDLERHLLRGQTPATPAISLMWALEAALDRVLAEGLEARIARHARMAGRTQEWARGRFGLFAEESFLSRTVTCVANTRGTDVAALNRFLRARGMEIAGGYGPLKERTFRIAHLGETRPEDLDILLAAVDEYLEQ